MTDGLVEALRRDTGAEVRFGAGDRHLYAFDASHYRQVPLGVVVPRSIDDVIATVATCREHGVALTHRGGGTSLAGQTVNTGVVIDSSKHLRGILDLDPERRLARVQPGVVLDDLRAAAAPHGLTFGPDPATHNRCTLGGMIGNNACGVHSLTAGRTSDNVEALDVLCYDGQRVTVSHGDATGPRFDALRELRRRYAPLIRERFPDIPRRVSGYNLEELLPERGFNVARALVGTEGTCVTVLEATVRLVDPPTDTALVLLGYPDIATAADDVPDLLARRPSGLEAADRRLLPGLDLPDGDGLLLVEVPADQAEALVASAARPARICRGLDATAVWRAREVGSAIAIPGEPFPGTGWEDAAVAPDRLGDYLRDFGRLLDAHGLKTLLYGHFGDGCVHARITFDHTTAPGILGYRRFVEEAADLVVAHGGSLSGEHGDGQARGELLAKMFGDDLVAAFGQFKAIWDPDNLMNPGKVVDPRPLDADLRLAAPLDEPETRFAYPDDDGSFAAAQRRCVGVGLCRRDDGAGTMCPSYMVTHEEAHSTRGRARLLHEMLDPASDLDGWRDESVRDALDLCLSCKGCKTDCPVNVDMATYKAEFLAHHWAGRLRPRSHYALGLAARWARIGARLRWVANPLGRSRTLKRLAGLAPDRDLPRLARRDRRRRRPDADEPTVTLFADTFSDCFAPDVVDAAVTVLEAAGHTVQLAGSVCCGRPLYDVGMLSRARRHLERLVAALPGDRPLVVLEPSCLAVFRDELPAMLPDDPGAQRLSARARSLAEALVDAGWQPPDLPPLVVHPHCQQNAVVGMDAERALLPDATFLDAGCCGLAGGFGYEAGEKYAVSVAAGERVLAPAVRAAPAGTVVVADGFSCRSQLAHLVPERRVVHLAEALATALTPEVV